MLSRDPQAAESQLPRKFERLFWDCDFDTLDLRKHRSYIIRRILDRGDSTSFAWLRETVGDDAIRDWFLTKQGGGLDPPKLRFWELILDLPSDAVDEWVKKARQNPWHRRTHV